MAVRDVLQLGDPDLRRTARPVAAATDLTGLVADLADTLHHWRSTTGYGRGIAAPQVGADVRVVHLDLGEPWTLVNPEITAADEPTWVVWDACLSVGVQLFGQVRRAPWVDVTWTDLDGARHELRAEGDLAELLQHELDHLDGVVFTDRLVSTDTLCMRQEFERRHRDTSPYAT